jgi:hypothetical protein
MKDIDNSSFELSAISAAELARISGGAGEWGAYTDDLKKRLGPMFQSPTPELKNTFCGLAALQAGKNYKNEDGSPVTSAQRVDAAKGTRALCLRSRRLPIGEIIP